MGTRDSDKQYTSYLGPKIENTSDGLLYNLLIYSFEKKYELSNYFNSILGTKASDISNNTFPTTFPPPPHHHHHHPPPSPSPSPSTRKTKSDNPSPLSTSPPSHPPTVDPTSMGIQRSVTGFSSPSTISPSCSSISAATSTHPPTLSTSTLAVASAATAAVASLATSDELSPLSSVVTIPSPNRNPTTSYDFTDYFRFVDEYEYEHETASASAATATGSLNSSPLTIGTGLFSASSLPIVFNSRTPERINELTLPKLSSPPPLIDLKTGIHWARSNKVPPLEPAEVENHLPIICYDRKNHALKDHKAVKCPLSTTMKSHNPLLSQAQGGPHHGRYCSRCFSACPVCTAECKT